MKDVHYEFIDLDSDENFHLLGRSLGGVIKNKALCFDNSIAQGELIKSSPDNGLWIRKWKFTVLRKLTLHKKPAPPEDEKKFILIYFLDPTIFDLKNNKKSISINGPRNNMFLTSQVPIDFSVVPKQPFYVLDIAFTTSWLSNQIADADPCFKNLFDKYIYNNATPITLEACTIDEYKLLHELEVSMVADKEDALFIRSRVYNLILSFFNKVVNKESPDLVKTSLHYNKIILAESLLMEDIKKPPKLEAIAKRVNLSVSSLLRQFKLMHGKGVYEYYVEKKMELAKKMFIENNFSVKEVAEMLGYNQASAFIQSFTKHFGCSPGSLRLESNKQLFF